MPPPHLTLYNTLTRRLEPFTPADPARITFYSCGPTVYDDAHIGNFRSFLAADLLRRWMESPLCVLTNSPAGAPRRVMHVMNITDVGHMTDDDSADGSGEDKMVVAGKRLEEAKKSGKLPPNTELNPRDPYQIARFYESRFKEDARRLGLKLVLDADADPTLMPRATESVPGMIAMIERLIAKGHAYSIGQHGSRVVYFRVRSFAPYGTLSGNTLDRLKEGEGGRVDAANQSTKEHPADFLLWKEDPRHLMKWTSPWGEGYPGWHIECSVMSAQRLRSRDIAALAIHDDTSIIDLHSGGEDNIFPHHECEIAQSCCAFHDHPDKGSYARAWFHPRFLMVEGQKMSKSTGNFYTARDLFAQGIEPGALRLELIRTHYRSNANFTMQGLADAQRTIDRWRRITDAHPATNPDPAHPAARAFADAMHDDLNIAAAIAAINSWLNTLASPTAQDSALLRLFDQTLGVLSLERLLAVSTAIAAYAPGVEPSPLVETKLQERRDARAAKDFKRSDQIRDELAALGYAIKDMPQGKVEVRRA
jgi:cysteinyl-tRNA synthetase